MRAKSQNKSLHLKIGGKDKDGAVCFKNELFGGKKPTSLGQTVQNENDWKPREDKDFQEQRNQKCLCTNILEVMKMTEGKDKDLAVCFKKALFLFKILLHASPITSPPDGCIVVTFVMGELIFRRLF